LALSHRVAVLDGGRIQQVDTPEEVYRCPANVQVARLLCQPLNWLNGRFVGEKELVFAMASLELPLPAMETASWLPFRNRQVTVGIRSEDIEISARNSQAGVLKMEVDLIESMEEGYLATCTGPGMTVAGLCRTRLVRGQQVMLAINWKKALLFDQTTGRTLGLEAG
jgi:multiple sugar transport system ATP-binding protein